MIAQVYARLAATRAYDLAMRLPIVAWHLWLAYRSLPGLVHVLQQPTADHAPLAIAGRASIFLLLISFAALALVRHPPVLRGAGVLGRVVALIGTTCFGLIVFLPWQELPPLMLEISLALIAFGWSLAIYTLRHLGRSLSIMPEARRLVTTGPYRIVRHPLYLCELVAMLGAALQFALPEALILWAIQAGFQFTRCLNEERVLRTAFAEYEAYAARTARILPGLY